MPNVGEAIGFGLLNATRNLAQRRQAEQAAQQLVGLIGPQFAQLGPAGEQFAKTLQQDPVQGLLALRRLQEVGLSPQIIMQSLQAQQKFAAEQQQSQARAALGQQVGGLGPSIAAAGGSPGDILSAQPKPPSFQRVDDINADPNVVQPGRFNPQTGLSEPTGPAVSMPQQRQTSVQEITRTIDGQPFRAKVLIDTQTGEEIRQLGDFEPVTAGGDVSFQRVADVDPREDVVQPGVFNPKTGETSPTGEPVRVPQKVPEAQRQAISVAQQGLQQVQQLRQRVEANLANESSLDDPGLRNAILERVSQGRLDEEGDVRGPFGIARAATGIANVVGRNLPVNASRQRLFTEVKTLSEFLLKPSTADTGRLSDFDVQRIKDNLPKPDDRPEVLITKLNVLEDIFKNKIAVMQSGTQPQAEQPDLSTLSDDELRKLAGL